MSEVKPVTRYELDTAGEGYNFGDAIPVCREHPEGEWVAYAEHRHAIDRLTAERDQLRHERGLLFEQIAKTEERADFATAERDDALAAVSSKAGWEWKKRAEQAEAERDAAVSLAERLYEHLEYAGWGDSWERGISSELRNEAYDFFEREA